MNTYVNKYNDDDKGNDDGGDCYGGHGDDFLISKLSAGRSLPLLGQTLLIAIIIPYKLR